MRKIVVMPVKNEDWILRQTLSALCCWADVVIIADQNSTDQTLEICKQFHKVKVISNPAQFHSSNVRKMLLDEARKIEEPKVIFSFDADEIPTAHILKPSFWQKIESLPKGTGIELEWVNLWRGTERYRADKGLWAGSWKACAFIDDGEMQYDSLNVINDHTSRLPLKALNNIERCEFPKVLHFQFVDWERMLSKQALYRMREFIQRPHSFLETTKINLKYYTTKDERGLQTRKVPVEWLKGYRDRGHELKPSVGEKYSWFDSEIVEEFSQNGAKHYRWLDIWDVNWEEKAELIARFRKTENIKKIYSDPRSLIQKSYHKIIGLINIPFLTKLYLLFKK